MSLLLPPLAEGLRLEIKQLITEATLKQDLNEETAATVFTEDQHGVKSYEGEVLSEKVTQLIQNTSIGRVWAAHVCVLIWTLLMYLLNHRNGAGGWCTSLVVGDYVTTRSICVWLHWPQKLVQYLEVHYWKGVWDFCLKRLWLNLDLRFCVLGRYGHDPMHRICYSAKSGFQEMGQKTQIAWLYYFDWD